MPKKVVFIALILVAGCLWAQEQKETNPPASTNPNAASPHPTVISDEDKARKNPIPFVDYSVERGKKIFNTQCALCHGDKGDGKGELAADMKITPPDFTKPDTLKNRTDGELFAIIGKGQDPMPPQGGRLSDEHRWYLVNYLRSLSGKVPQKSNGKVPEENVILVPQ